MRQAGIVAVLCVFSMLGASAADAQPLPAGPLFTFGVWKTSKPMELKIQATGAEGGARRTLVGDGRIWPLPFDGGSWSPDGSMLAFAGAPRRNEAAKSRLYLVAADGGSPVPVPGTQEGHEPVFSPDGHTLAFSRTKLELKLNLKDPLNFHEYSSTTTWLVDLSSGGVKRLTPWRNGFRVNPTSFSPDGSKLLVEREKAGIEEVALLDLATGAIKPFARHARDATYSPDGSKIALISE